MALSLEEKKAIVADVAEIAATAHSAVAAEYTGISSNEMNELRSEARKGGVYLRIVKNSLAKRAVEGTDYECMSETFTGPLILAFSQEDPGSAARVIKAFAKEHEQLVVKALSVGGQLLAANEIERLASLPTKEQAISMLMSVMQAPVTKLARTLNEVPGKMVRTFAAVRDQKAAG
ncbi:MAG: 50S ribosomal protein L10 [Thioalkalispiraceae bacterium]